MSARAAAAAAVVWCAAAGLALHERGRGPRPDREPPAREGPLLSVVVPARDEERGIGAAIRSLRAQTYPSLEVIVVDDRSRDGTAAAARAAAAGDPRVRVVDGRPLPPGWVGKPWACRQGADRARGDWLLFTDADVLHAPEALARAMALALRLGRGGLTMFPLVECATPAERVVTPAALAAIATFVAPGPLARSPRSRVAIGAGAFLLIERGLYEAVGGHAAVRHRMVDDVCLAAAVKDAGGLLVPVRSGGLLRLRMYHGAREAWRGWSKNASFGTGGGAARSLAGAALLAALALTPTAALAAGAHRRDRPLAAAGLAGWAGLAALQRLSAWAAPTPARYAPTLPLGLLVICAAAVRGALGRLAGAGPEWRGRRYPEAR